MEDKKFIKGIFFKLPHEKAPEFVKGKISIKVDEFKAFLDKYKKEDGYVNLDLKLSKTDRFYCELDTYRQNKAKNEPVSSQNPQMVNNTTEAPKTPQNANLSRPEYPESPVMSNPVGNEEPIDLDKIPFN